MSMRHLALVLVAFLGATVTTTCLAEDKAAAPILTAIFPSSPVLPANHLKFYLHFSEPMRQGVFLDHCKLLDDHGRPVLEPFRETELWSENGRRLTLWLHPGRQKTGVNLNTEFGPVLMAGRRYTLLISREWPSESGVQLGSNIEKSFFASERVTKQLDVADWEVSAPPAGSMKPLEIRFPAPLDHALLQRCLRVLDGGIQALAGTSSTASYEQVWRFTPSKPWTNSPHTVVVDSILEDLAGNSLARPFEVDLQGPTPPKVPSTLHIPFHPSDSPKS